MAFLLLATAVPLWRCLLMGEWIGPWDWIATFAPWNKAAPAKPFDILMMDGTLQFYAWRDLIFQTGNIVWNPYQLGGHPLLANSQSAPLYPPHVVMGALPIPTMPAMVLLAWLHLFWAALGVFWVARLYDVSNVSAALAGALFGCSAFMLAWVPLPSVVTTCSWIPWLIAGATTLIRLAQQPLGLATFARMCLACVPVPMVLMSGHLQFAAYGLMAWGIVLLFGARTWLERPVQLMSAVLAAALVTGIAAPQVVPVLQYGELSHRRTNPTGEGYQAYLGGALQPFEFAALLDPLALGNPRAVADGPISQYWPALSKRGANYAEGAVGVGGLALLALLMGLLGRGLGRRHAPLVAVLLLGLLIALPTPFNALLYFNVPGWNSTGSPGRAAVLVVLGLCFLAAFGLDSARQHAEQLSKRVFASGLALAVLFIAAASFASQGMTPWFGDQGKELLSVVAGMATTAMFRSTVIAVVGGGLILWLIASACPKRKGAGLALALAMPLVLLGPSFVVTAPDGPPAWSGKPTGRTVFINENWELLVPGDALVPPNLATIYRVPELAGYDSLIDSQTYQLLIALNRQDPAPPANGNIAFIKPTVDRLMLGPLGVQEVWSVRPVPPLGVPAATEPMYRYQINGSPLADFNGTPLEVDPGGPYRFQVEGPGTLTLRQNHLEGWRTVIDGVEKRSTMGPLNQIVAEVPSGPHVVTFYYNPYPSWVWPMAWLSWAVVLASAIVMVSRPKPAQGNPTNLSHV